MFPLNASDELSVVIRGSGEDDEKDIGFEEDADLDDEFDADADEDDDDFDDDEESEEKQRQVKQDRLAC